MTRYDPETGEVHVPVHDWFEEVVQARRTVEDPVLRDGLIAELERLGYAVTPPEDPGKDDHGQGQAQQGDAEGQAAQAQPPAEKEVELCDVLWMDRQRPGTDELLRSDRHQGRGRRRAAAMGGVSVEAVQFREFGPWHAVPDRGDRTLCGRNARTARRMWEEWAVQKYDRCRRCAVSDPRPLTESSADA